MKIEDAFARAQELEGQGWDWSGVKENWVFNRRLEYEMGAPKPVYYFLWAFRWGIGPCAILARKRR